MVTDADESFDQRLRDTFFKEDSKVQNSDPEFFQFQKEALSNLLGNIGHQYGTLKYLV